MISYVHLSNSLNPLRTALPFLGTNCLELESGCPENGMAVPKGLRYLRTHYVTFLSLTRAWYNPRTDKGLCREFDSHRLHNFVIFERARWRHIMNGFDSEGPQRSLYNQQHTCFRIR
ncbi:unnamed protein product [Laminaria digitata]